MHVMLLNQYSVVPGFHVHIYKIQDAENFPFSSIAVVSASAGEQFFVFTWVCVVEVKTVVILHQLIFDRVHKQNRHVVNFEFIEFFYFLEDIPVFHLKPGLLKYFSLHFSKKTIEKAES